MTDPLLIPDPLPWDAVARPLAAAEDALARLDESGQGLRQRQRLRPSCVQYIAGCPHDAKTANAAFKQEAPV